MIKICVMVLSAVMYISGYTGVVGDISEAADEMRLKPTAEMRLQPTAEMRLKPTAIEAAGLAAPSSGASEESNESIIDAPELSGKIITIDPGHQRTGNNELELVGPNSSQKKAKVSSGTKGQFSGKYEYELNLEVAFKLRDKLVEKGATVHMVRESHDVNISNIERATFANDKNSDISVRIHADGSTNPSVRGFSLLVPGNAHIKDQALLAKSNAAAQCMEKTIIEATSAKSRGIVVRNDLTGFNWLQTPSVLVEMGFMSNKEDDMLLSNADYQHKMAEGIAQGLVEYFNAE